MKLTSLLLPALAQGFLPEMPLFQDMFARQLRQKT